MAAAPKWLGWWAIVSGAGALFFFPFPGIRLLRSGSKGSAGGLAVLRGYRQL